MTDRELMQQALEALEADEHDMVTDKEGHMIFRKEVAIAALRERLAQPTGKQDLQVEEPCDKDPRGCWNVRCQLGKVCVHARGNNA